MQYIIKIKNNLLTFIAQTYSAYLELPTFVQFIIGFVVVIIVFRIISNMFWTIVIGGELGFFFIILRIGIFLAYIGIFLLFLIVLGSKLYGIIKILILIPLLVILIAGWLLFTMMN